MQGALPDAAMANPLQLSLKPWHQPMHQSATASSAPTHSTFGDGAAVTAAEDLRGGGVRRARRRSVSKQGQVVAQRRRLALLLRVRLTKEIWLKTAVLLLPRI